MRVIKKSIAIFTSGSGSDAENIIQYFQKNDSVQVPLVLFDKGDAYALERTRRLGVPSNVFPKGGWVAGDEILAISQEYRIDFAMLAGFLVRVPDLLLHAYPDKIISIYPALLPKFGGKGMYGDRVHEAVVATGGKKSGTTIHCINEHYDEGSTIFQATCSVLSTDSPDDVAEKVHILERGHFPQIIEQVLNNKN